MSCCSCVVRRFACVFSHVLGFTYIMRIRIYVYMSCCVTGGRASCASPELRVAGLCTSPNYVCDRYDTIDIGTRATYVV